MLIAILRCLAIVCERGEQQTCERADDHCTHLRIDGCELRRREAEVAGNVVLHELQRWVTNAGFDRLGRVEVWFNPNLHALGAAALVVDVFDAIRTLVADGGGKRSFGDDVAITFTPGLEPLGQLVTSVPYTDRFSDAGDTDDARRLALKIRKKAFRQLPHEGPTLLVVRTRWLVGLPGALLDNARAIAARLEETLRASPNLSALLMYEEVGNTDVDVVFERTLDWTCTRTDRPDGGRRTTLLLLNASASSPLSRPEIGALIGPSAWW